MHKFCDAPVTLITNLQPLNHLRYFLPKMVLLVIGLMGASATLADESANPDLTPTRPVACLVNGPMLTIGNAVVNLQLVNNMGWVTPHELTGRSTRDHELEQLHLDGQLISGSDKDSHKYTFKLNTPAACDYTDGHDKPIDALQATTAKLVLRGELLPRDFPIGGSKIFASLTLESHSDENVITVTSTLSTAQDLMLNRLYLLDLQLATAQVMGSTNGVPATSQSFVLMAEHPMVETEFVNGHLQALLRRVLPLRANTPISLKSSFLYVDQHSKRRAFNEYIEKHRAHPYRTFLHYNSWYDIGYFTRYGEADALGAINAIGEPLGKRGVSLDSFLFDDGWDDPTHLWQFNKDFPHEFAPLTAAAARFGGAPGIWLSPWGGYGAPRTQRLNAAETLGLEQDSQGLALSGPKYYALFHERMVQLLKTQHINQLKLDGTGSPDKVTPGSEFDSDFAAARQLIHDLRQISPELYINLTTGTWPSPFWLNDVDSIWRGGEDHAFLGTGSDRERWITYRDADTYGGVVRISPWYPLNALMLHGIIFARHAKGLDHATNLEFQNEVWSYFASGTGLLELYISGELLNDVQWDSLASAAKWARAHQSVLRDAHWIGGDPAQDAIYGHAGWNDRQGYLQLRNPAARHQTIVLTLAQALDDDTPGKCYQLTERYESSNGRASMPRNTLNKQPAQKPVTIDLAPWQVMVFDVNRCQQ